MLVLSSTKLREKSDLLSEIIKFSIKSGYSFNRLLQMRDFDDYHHDAERHEKCFSIFEGYIHSLHNNMLSEILKYELMHITAAKSFLRKLKDISEDIREQTVIYANYTHQKFKYDIASFVEAINTFKMPTSIKRKDSILLAHANAGANGNIIETMEVDANTYNLLALINGKRTFKQILEQYSKTAQRPLDASFEIAAKELFRSCHGYIYWN